MASYAAYTTLLSVLFVIYLPIPLSAARNDLKDAIVKDRNWKCYTRCMLYKRRFPCPPNSDDCGGCLSPIASLGKNGTCHDTPGNHADKRALLDMIIKRDQGADGLEVETGNVQPPPERDQSQPDPDQPAADAGAEINQADPDLAGTADNRGDDEEAQSSPLLQPDDSDAAVEVEEPQPNNGGIILLAEWQFILIVCGCVAVAIVGVAVAFICWYKIQTTSKAQNEADYPAYGVTGPGTQITPTINNGDRKLAQSAQMYHYQHQKQQMIAMEKREKGEVQRDASDYDSEEENEDGDLTVYECPGLAPTGEMQVKNPLFAEDAYPKPAVEETEEEKQ